ncbi:hypothetical protein ACTA71_010609 [Dictyostelium dimigraforme]
MINTILIKLLLILFSFHFLFAEEDLISTPPGYYNLTCHKRYPRFTDYQLNQQSQFTDLYYPDVCSNAIRNLPLPADHGPFAPFLFPGFNSSGFNSIYITKDISVSFIASSTYRFLFVCVEGSFTVTGENAFSIRGLVILPGGKFESSSGIQFLDHNDYLQEPNIYPNLPKDPFSFFPGILVLDGTLNVVGPESIVYRAYRISDSSIMVTPQFFGSKENYNYIIKIFTGLYPQGFYCRFDTDREREIFTLTNYTDLGCFPISENDKIIRVLIYIDFAQDVIFSTNIKTGDKTEKGSIYITGQSNVYFKNCYFQGLGLTTNEPYNDTKLTFSQDNPNTVTDIIMGTNQRYRSSLYIEFSNNVTIDGCAFEETIQTRSPLVLFDSNVIISNSFILSESGSNMIAQYGTETIQSSNNSFILKTIDTNSSPLDINQNNMDYGNQGNGIYSLSPNIKSDADYFYGQQYAFNYYLISNSNQDNNGSLFTNSKPIELVIMNPTFYSNFGNSLNKYLLSINGDGNNTSTYFTIKSLIASHAINVNLNDSALTFYNLKANKGFKMEGNVERLDIISSNINSNTVNETIQNISTSTMNIFDSYVYSSSSSDIQPFNKQIYGSLITPYYYSDSITLDQIRIKSIFPNVPIQIVSGSPFNMIVQIQNLTSSISMDDISCIFTSSLFNETTVKVNSNNICILPIAFNKEEGSFDIRVTLVNDKSPSSSPSNNYLYIIDFPKITVFNNYTFYSGWFMDNSSSTQQISIGGNLFQNGCNQVGSNCTISKNSKYKSDLPNVANQTEIDQLDELFSNGITSTNPNEKVIISTKINSKINYYQIQLFFTHLPIDDQPTPLSIYIENQAVFLMEPIKSTFPTFKNFTFKFENQNSLDKISIAFTTRGDIYLTSIATYSSIEIESPTQTAKPTTEPITDLISKTPVNNNHNLALKIALSICLSLSLFI